MALLRLLVVISCFFIIQNSAYPNGAPKKACIGSMEPRHKGAQPQPLSTSPITKFATKWNSDNETITVNIESDKALKGIFVQGRKPNGTEPIGTFINIPAETHLVECSTGDGITHSSPQSWKTLELTWKKPESVKSEETIQFWATVLINYKTFWVVKSFE